MSFVRIPSSDTTPLELDADTTAAIAEAASLWIVVLDRDARIVSFNSACQRATGFSAHELIGEPLGRLVPAEQLAETEAVLRDLLDTGQAKPHENEWITKGGTRRRIAWTNTVVRDAEGVVARVVKTGIDVTDLRASEAKRREAESRFAGIVRSAMDAIVAIDREQRIVLFNPAAEQMFGRTSAEVLSQPLDLLVPERFRAVHREHVERFACSGRTSRRMGQLGNVWGLRADGKEFPIEASISHTGAGDSALLTVILRDVTQLRAAEAERSESESRLSGVVMSAMDAIVTADEQQRIVVFNPAAERMFRRKSEDVLGKSLDLLIPGRFQSDHHEHVARFARSGQTSRAMGKLGRVWGIRADGHEFPIEASISQMARGDGSLLTVILRDITDRERAAATTALLASIVRSSNDAIIGTDRKGRIVSWNPAAQEIYGHARHDAEGMAFATLLAPERAAEVEPVFEQVRDGRNVGHFETIGVRADGARFDVSLSVSPRRDGSGAVVGASIVARDVSEQRLLQRRLRQTEELAAVATLVTGIAHDIGTPMNVILGYTDLLARSLREEKDRDRIRIIREQVERVTRLIQALMNFARPQRETPRSFRIEEVVDRALGLIVETARNRGITVARDFGDTAPIVAQSERLERAFLDLFVNACDAMATVKNGTLRVVTRPVQDGVEIEVRDTGIGIAPDVVGKIFEPFFTTKPRGKGTGLGLLVTRSIVAEHGGTIDVRSIVGSGTVFRLFLPTEPPAASGEPEA